MSAESAASVSCRGCGQRVFFVRTVAGKKLPVNLEPDPAGNTAVYRDGSGCFVGRSLTKADPTPAPFEKVYMPHMATCTKLHRSTPGAPLPANVIPISKGREVRTGR